MRQLSPTLDEESTDIDEFGAFASLLSGPSSEDEICEVALEKTIAEEVAVPLPEPQSAEEADQSSDVEKSTMVCRHWKSKGWCRLESKCKFQHPENKRGVAAAPKGNGHCHAKCGGISGVECSGMRTTLSLIDALVGNEGQSLPASHKKRKNKDKAVTGSREQLSGITQAAAGPTPSAEYFAPCAPCTYIVQLP
jgi:hypothetical protein